MRWSVVVRWFVSFLIALPVGLFILFPTLWRCLAISYSTDFQQTTLLGRTVFTAQTVTPRQRELLATHLQMASARIRAFWGSQRGRAVLIYCPTQAQYARYCSGGEGAGCSLGMPWGDSFLVIGPEGNSPDVLAHELCHDELFARLGWLTTKRQVPQWFNEGLALMVDYRFSSGSTDARERFLVYDAEWQYRVASLPGHAAAPPKLATLETTRDFFYGDYSRVMLAYLTAGREVARWLATVGHTALPRLLTDLAAGQSFADVYQFAHVRKVKVPDKNVPGPNRSPY